MYTYVFATDLLLSELDLYERSNCGHELPPWPAFDTTVLLYVLLDTADGHILDLSHTNIDMSDKIRQRDNGKQHVMYIKSTLEIERDCVVLQKTTLHQQLEMD